MNIKLRKAKLKRDTEMFGSMDPYCEVNIPPRHNWKSAVAKEGGVKPNWHCEGTNFTLDDTTNKHKFI